MGQSKKEGYLAGKLLLATPGMGDPRFHRAVIFLCAHDENGAMGLVINHVMPGIGFRDLIGQLKVQSDIKLDLEKLDMSVMCGGPVESARGFLLHSSDFIRDDTLQIDNLYGVTGTVEALREVVHGNRPDAMLFILGYAGWDAGQLDAEIQDNAWLVVDPDPDLVFGGAPEEKWVRAVRKLGVDPAMLSAFAGRA